MSDLERDESEDPGRGLMRRLEERDQRSCRAHAAAAELMGLPAAERPAFAGGHPDCLSPEFIELMIAMARERRGPAPEESVAFAHLAATAAEAAHAAGADDVDDARALAFAELGNAHRICGDLRRAGVAFGLARERVRFAPDPLVKAEVDSLEASYLDKRGEVDKSERLLARAERIQRACGSPDGVGRIQVQRGLLAHTRGDWPEAIQLLRGALALVDPCAEPQLVLIAVHNLAASLIEAGDYDAALSLLRRNRYAYEANGSSLALARFTWLEGKAALRAGLLSLAESALEEAREAFASEERPYEAALICLDLAEASARQQRWTEVEELAATTLALCRACGVEPEALAAANLLHHASQQRQLSTEALLALAATVRERLKPLAG